MEIARLGATLGLVISQPHELGVESLPVSNALGQGRKHGARFRCERTLRVLSRFNKPLHSRHVLTRHLEVRQQRRISRCSLPRIKASGVL